MKLISILCSSLAVLMSSCTSADIDLDAAIRNEFRGWAYACLDAQIRNNNPEFDVATRRPTNADIVEVTFSPQDNQDYATVRFHPRYVSGQLDGPPHSVCTLHKTPFYLVRGYYEVRGAAGVTVQFTEVEGDRLEKFELYTESLMRAFSEDPEFFDENIERTFLIDEILESNF